MILKQPVEKTAELRVERRALADLKPHPDNPRDHPPPGSPEYETLKASIEHDYFQPIEINDRNGMIVGGHLRCKIMIDLDYTHAMCVILDYDEPTHKARLIAANAQTGTNNQDALDRLLCDLRKSDVDPVLALMDSLGDETPPPGDGDPDPDIDRAAELNKMWQVKPGDVWQIGEHRMMCGDCRHRESVARLLNGGMVDLLFTSPPYGAEKSARIRDHYERGQIDRKSFYQDQRDDPSTWIHMMDQWWAACDGLFAVAVVNVQMLAGNKRQTIQWMHARMDRFCDVIVWDKASPPPQMQRCVMNNAFEFLFVFASDGASRTMPMADWHGSICNVYRGGGQRSSEFRDVHAATFPLHLPVFVIGELCNLSQSIIDPFLGSGTTMVADQNLGRKCYGMEISPNYCAVILDRMQRAFPGIEIKRVER